MANIPEVAVPDPIDELAELLHAVGRRVRRAARAELEPVGLTPARARALHAIVSADTAGRPIRMGRLAAALHVAPRSATEVVEALVAAGLVVRDADPNDRRAVALRPTSAGRTVAARVAGARRRAVAELAGDLTPADLATLRALLHRLDQG